MKSGRSLISEMLNAPYSSSVAGDTSKKSVKYIRTCAGDGSVCELVTSFPDWQSALAANVVSLSYLPKLRSREKQLFVSLLDANLDLDP